MLLDEIAQRGPDDIGFIGILESKGELLKFLFGLRVDAGFGERSQPRFSHGPFVTQCVPTVK